jgi:RNA polymerase sigma-70 factor (ECF subfamily)
MVTGPAPCVADRADVLVRLVYREHGAALLSFCAAQLGGDRQTAEDVVQETIFRAWRQAARLDTEVRSLRPWLITVAKRLIVDLRRRRSSRPREVAVCAAEAVPATDEIDRALSRVAVRDALAGLAPAHRQILAELYLRDRTVAEAAAELGVPLGTAKSRLCYALKALRLAFDEHRLVA